MCLINFIIVHRSYFFFGCYFRKKADLKEVDFCKKFAIKIEGVLLIIKPGNVINYLWSIKFYLTMHLG